MFTVQLDTTVKMNASEALLSRLLAVNSAVNVLYDVVNESPQNTESPFIASVVSIDVPITPTKTAELTEALASMVSLYLCPCSSLLPR